MLATGGLSGDGTLDELRTHGAATGRLAAARALSVAHRIQARTARARAVEGPEPDWAADDRLPLRRDFHPELFRSDTHGMIDFSEDVGSKDLLAAREGYTPSNWSNATNGRRWAAAGKLETANTGGVRRRRGAETSERWAPPFWPLPMLRSPVEPSLGGLVFEPVRVSPIQPGTSHGVRTILAGQLGPSRPLWRPCPRRAQCRSKSGINRCDSSRQTRSAGPTSPTAELLYTKSGRIWRWGRFATG